MTEFWTWMTTTFNNREIAGAFWLAGVMLLSCVSKDIRRSLAQIIALTFQKTLLRLLILFATNVAVICFLASKLLLWNVQLLAPTLVWFFTGGLVLLGRSFKAKEGSSHFRGYATDVVSGVAFFEFIYLAKTFSLGVELALVPVVTYIGLLAVISEREAKYAAVNKIATWLLLIIGSTILANSIGQIWEKPGEFWNADTFKSFVLPIYLTIGSIPFFYCLFCYSTIERVSHQIDFTGPLSAEIKRYAKRRLFLTFLLRPWLLRRAARQLHLMTIKSNKDVNLVIDEILQYEREEDSPPDVLASDGWSPYAAREFLAEVNLRTADYHSGGGEDEWWATVVSTGLDESILPATANYSFEGIRGVVKTLRLRGHFVDEFLTDESQMKFSEIAQLLCAKAVSEGIELLDEPLKKLTDFDIHLGTTRAKLELKRFPNEMGFNLIFELTRSLHESSDLSVST
ncbi:hypothetical protein [Epibacterium ulvae]|uniref:hypothetical protein n=1 Tax=Epibacterium ulvae TaxID=1156985 RepID=UPI002491BCC3|nr:hypothetical protein [Epibacterium ulvae]